MYRTAWSACGSTMLLDPFGQIARLALEYCRTRNVPAERWHAQQLAHRRSALFTVWGRDSGHLAFSHDASVISVQNCTVSNGATHKFKKGHWQLKGASTARPIGTFRETRTERSCRKRAICFHRPQRLLADAPAQLPRLPNRLYSHREQIGNRRARGQLLTA